MSGEESMRRICGTGLCKEVTLFHNPAVSTPCKRGKPDGPRKTGGRRAGTPNLVTREFCETVNALLTDNAHISIWVDAVAEGDPAIGRPPDSAGALNLLIRLAEFAAPKLARVEYSDPQNQAIQSSAIALARRKSGL